MGRRRQRRVIEICNTQCTSNLPLRESRDRSVGAFERVIHEVGKAMPTGLNVLEGSFELLERFMLPRHSLASSLPLYSTLLQCPCVCIWRRAGPGCSSYSILESIDDLYTNLCSSIHVPKASSSASNSPTLTYAYSILAITLLPFKYLCTNNVHGLHCTCIAYINSSITSTTILFEILIFNLFLDKRTQLFFSLTHHSTLYTQHPSRLFLIIWYFAFFSTFYAIR